MGDLATLIAQATEKVSSLIQKPKMSEKLLSKPPFRFLHDTITAITATTGFGEGLYSGEELDSAGIQDKNAKMAYLDKIFRLVGICKVCFIHYFFPLKRSHLYFFVFIRGLNLKFVL